VSLSNTYESRYIELRYITAYLISAVVEQFLSKHEIHILNNDTIADSSSTILIP